MKTYILSGGKSSRMGTDKGLQHVNDKPLISYLIHTLQQLALDITIIANNSDYQRFNLDVMADIYPEKGPLGGVFTALWYAKSDCLILSVDTPFINKNHIENLIEKHTNGTLTLAFSEGKMFPLFGIYPYKLIEKIEIHLKNNQLKLMQFLVENEFQKIECNFSTLEKININSQEELQIVKKLLSHEN